MNFYQFNDHDTTLFHHYPIYQLPQARPKINNQQQPKLGTTIYFKLRSGTEYKIQYQEDKQSDLSR